MLIKECEPVGELLGRGFVYKIRSIVLLQPRGPDVSATELGLKLCKKHKTVIVPGFLDTSQKAAFSKTWGTIKFATNTLKNTTQQAAALATSQVSE